MAQYDFFNKWAPVFMGYLIEDFGVSVEDAAAVVGNAGHESAGFKSLQELKPVVPGSRGGYGIMMWTGPRRRAYEEYCKRHGYSPSDMETNYKFLFVELKGPEGKVLPELKAAKGLDAKVEVFSKKFLRPGIPHMDSRKIWAKRALDAYGTQPVIPEPNSKEEVMNILTSLVTAVLGKNAKAIGAGMGALLGLAIDPTVLGPIVSDPALQQAVVTALSAIVGAWFAPKNK